MPLAEETNETLNSACACSPKDDQSHNMAHHLYDKKSDARTECQVKGCDCKSFSEKK